MIGYCTKYLRYLPLAVAALLLCSWPGSSQPGNPAAQMGAEAANNTLTPAETAQGWISLFDGHSLTGWQPLGNAPWMAEDGTLSVTIVPPIHGDLLTTASFSDFDLKLDFWTEKKTSNSGVYLRSTQSPEGKWSWYEVNISDASDGYPTGSVSNFKTTLPDRADTSGKWNAMEMIAEGGHIVVKLNGKTTVDFNDTKFASGPIGLQGGGSGVIRFRNIKIRPLTGAHG
jgi:hypothetical protein